MQRIYLDHNATTPLHAEVVDRMAAVLRTEFGNPSQVVAGQNIQFKLSGASIAGLLIVPLGPVDLFGKAGLMSWRSFTGRGPGSMAPTAAPRRCG